MEQSRILREALGQYFRNHGDVFIGADFPLVLDAETTVSPLLLVAMNTSDHARERWVVADEGMPEIFVVTAGSPAAAAKARFEELGAREFFVYDPAAGKVTGSWLGPRGFADITPGDNGRVGSDELRLELGVHQPQGGSPLLRFFKRSGEILETPAETEAIRRARIARLIETHESEIDEFEQEQKQK